jgi:hypothetical protein
MTPFLMKADWSASMKEKKLGMRGEALQVFPPQRRLVCLHAITISGPRFMIVVSRPDGLAVLAEAYKAASWCFQFVL